MAKLNGVIVVEYRLENGPGMSSILAKDELETTPDTRVHMPGVPDLMTVTLCGHSSGHLVVETSRMPNCQACERIASLIATMKRSKR